MSQGSHSSRHGKFRPVLTLVLVTLALIVGWVGLEVYLAYTAKPAIKVNYGEKLRELAEEWQVGGEENAWPYLVHAIETHKQVLSELRDENDVGWYDRPYRYNVITDYDWSFQMASDEYHRTGRDWEEILKELDTAKEWALNSLSSFGDRGIWDDLDKLAVSQHVIMPVEEPEYGYKSIGPVPSIYPDSRELARAYWAGMHWSSSRGDWKRYAISMEHCLALGRVLMMQPNTLSWLTGYAIRGLATSKLRDDLVMGHIPVSVVEMIREAFLRQSDLPPMSYTMEVNRFTELDMIQRMFTSSGRHIPAQYASIAGRGKPLHWANNLKSFSQPRWPTIERRVNAIYDERINKISMPRWKRYAQSEYMKLSKRRWMTRSASLDDHMSKMCNVWMYGNLSDKLLAQEQGLALLLAIEHHAAEQDIYPESLGMLVPQYIAEIPDDPYAPEDRKWQYRLIPDAARGDIPYILYSIGFDGIDNGGIPPEGEKPGAALSIRMFSGEIPGVDYVVTAKKPQP